MKHKIEIKSVFEQIANEVFTMTNVNDAKQFINDFINEKKIKEQDKTTIITNVNSCKGIAQIQRYLCNSLLKYEGMGVK